MKEAFNLVYQILMFISKYTGFSYKEVNIIIWFIIIPFSWCFLLDKAKKRHYFKATFTVFILISLLMIKNFSVFSNKIFHESAQCLRSFNSLGSNYITSSVVVCIVIPFIVYLFLIKYAYFRKQKELVKKYFIL